jgi:hypothetical protein
MTSAYAFRARLRFLSPAVVLALASLAACGDAPQATGGGGSGGNDDAATTASSTSPASTTSATSTGSGGAGGSGGEGGQAPEPPDVVVIADDSNGGASDLADKLGATGAFASVDVFDLGTGSCPEAVMTPTLAELEAYDVALVYLDTFPQPFFELGDVLADYFDAGGRVVTTMIPVGGRFAGLDCSLAGQCAVSCNPGLPAYGLMPLSSPLDMGAPADTIGLVADATSPLVAGVDAFSVVTPLRFETLSLAPGASVVASWGSGAPMIIRGEVQGRERVDLNLVALSADIEPSYGWEGDGIRLLQNALLYGD